MLHSEMLEDLDQDDAQLNAENDATRDSLFDSIEPIKQG